jgi:hypothetical protein
MNPNENLEELKAKFIQDASGEKCAGYLLKHTGQWRKEHGDDTDYCKIAIPSEIHEALDQAYKLGITSTLAKIRSWKNLKYDSSNEEILYSLEAKLRELEQVEKTLTDIENES